MSIDKVLEMPSNVRNVVEVRIPPPLTRKSYITIRGYTSHSPDEDIKQAMDDKRSSGDYDGLFRYATELRLDGFRTQLTRQDWQKAEEARRGRKDGDGSVELEIYMAILKSWKVRPIEADRGRPTLRIELENPISSMPEVEDVKVPLPEVRNF